MKTKALWVLAAGAVLVLFAAQNWHYPDPPIQFLGFRFLPLPYPLIIYSCFLLGFLAGWLVHTWRVKRRKSDTAVPPPPAD
jgi:uncharacterized integral membrane protein